MKKSFLLTADEWNLICEKRCEAEMHGFIPSAPEPHVTTDAEEKIIFLLEEILNELRVERS